MDDLPIMCPAYTAGHFERYANAPFFEGWHICRLRRDHICWTHINCTTQYEPEGDL